MLILERTVTFIVGVLVVALGLFLWPREEVQILWIIASLIIILIGGYFMLAALIPHKKAVKDVSDETLEYILIELPIRLITRALCKIGDFL